MHKPNFKLLRFNKLMFTFESMSDLRCCGLKSRWIKVFLGKKDFYQCEDLFFSFFGLHWYFHAKVGIWGHLQRCRLFFCSSLMFSEENETKRQNLHQVRKQNGLARQEVSMAHCAQKVADLSQVFTVLQWFPTHRKLWRTYLAKNNQTTNSFTKVSSILIQLNFIRRTCSFVSAKRLKSWCNVWNCNAQSCTC